MSRQELTIDFIGAQGDGVARRQGAAPIFVPFALPGEQVCVTLEKSRGTLVDITKASDQRIAPACPHFGVCGGCTSQHMSPDLYRNWKLGLVQSAFEKAGIECQINRFLPCEPGERRRVTFTAQRSEGRLNFGFFQEGTHDIAPIEDCPIAVLQISQALDALKDLSQTLAPQSAKLQLTVTSCDNGLDVAINEDATLQDHSKQAAIRKVMSSDRLIRLSQGDDILIEKRPPVISFGDANIHPPSGSFVQASARAEKQMVEIVTKHLKSCKKIADLFSGCGTFTFPLARKSATHAVEAEGAALNAIDKAFRNRQGLKPITTERRDLFRRPLMRDELKHYQGVIFDPPRAGAQAQCKQLACSVVPKIAAVSCNPISLARDLKLLRDGRYKIKSITVIDQFLWTPHVEVVALLER